MKHIALLLGLILAAPAMAQNDTNTKRDDSPVTQRDKAGQKKAKQKQGPARQSQNGRGADRRRQPPQAPLPRLRRALRAPRGRTVSVGGLEGAVEPLRGEAPALLAHER